MVAHGKAAQLVHPPRRHVRAVQGSCGDGLVTHAACSCKAIPGHYRATKVNAPSAHSHPCPTSLRTRQGFHTERVPPQVTTTLHQLAAWAAGQEHELNLWAAAALLSKPCTAVQTHWLLVVRTRRCRRRHHPLLRTHCLQTKDPCCTLRGRSIPRNRPQTQCLPPVPKCRTLVRPASPIGTFAQFAQQNCAHAPNNQPDCTHLTTPATHAARLTDHRERCTSCMSSARRQVCGRCCFHFLKAGSDKKWEPSTTAD